MNAAFTGENGAFTQENAAFTGVNGPFTRENVAFTGVNESFTGENAAFTGVNEPFTRENAAFAGENTALGAANGAAGAVDKISDRATAAERRAIGGSMKKEFLPQMGHGFSPMKCAEGLALSV